MSTPPGSSGIPISAEVQAATVSAASHHHHLVDSSGYVDNETWSVKNARIIALRKEKSRDAARSRRGKENYEFYELAKMLPLPAAITSQLDKASIIRLTISYLRMRDFSSQGDPPWHSYIDMPPPARSVLQGRYQHSHSHSSANAVVHELYEHNLGSHILQSLDGFLFVLCSDGRFLYISETVSIYLGLSQVELTGSSVFDYVHPGDHAELAEQLGMKLPPARMMSPTTSSSTPSGAEGSPSTATSPVLTSPTSPQDALAMNMTMSGGQLERSFIVRMKSTLCKRGIQITSSGYKVIHITGSLRTRMMLTQYTRHPPVIMGFVALAYSLPPPTISEIHLDPTMFVCKVDLNLNVTFCEAKISEFLDYVSEDVVNKSFYSFLHAQDVASIRDSHADLLNKGQVITKYFRWMCKAGGYVWMQATATLTYSKNSSDKSFIFINQVLSKMEDMQCILDINQMASLPPDLKSDSSSGDSPDHESDSGHNTDSKKSRNSPRPSESHQDQSKKPDTPSGGSKQSKGRRRKCNPESKESKKRKMIGATAVSTAPLAGSITSNRTEDQMAKIDPVLNSGKVKEHEVNEVPKESPPMSSPARKEEDEVQENAKKPKIFPEDQSDPETGDIQVTNVLERTLVEERGGTPSTELTSNRLSPMIATQPNGHHREPELPVGNGGHRCESWENPPNKEIPHNHRDSLLHVQSPEQDEGHIGNIIVPKVPYSKAAATSPKPPESILTPPLSDSAKSQFPLPSVGSGMTSLRQDHIDISRTPPATAISSTYANSSSYAKSFLTASRAELASTHPALLAKSPTAYDSLDSQSSSMKQEPLYNTHPRVITAVSSAYTGMAYGNYGQYNNFQQYGSPVNLAAAHTYQTNPYGDPSMYKNYRSGHEMPMDLSYNNVGGFSNAAAMSLLHSNVSAATGGAHPYFHTSKMTYSASDGSLHSIHDKAQVEEAVRAAQQKV